MLHLHVLCDIGVLIASGGMVFVHGDLERFNWRYLRGVERVHSFVNGGEAHVFTVRSGGENLADKDVAGRFGLGKVRSKERVISGGV